MPPNLPAVISTNAETSPSLRQMPQIAPLSRQPSLHTGSAARAAATLIARLGDTQRRNVVPASPGHIPFQYTPLASNDEIRVLIVHSGKPDEILDCSLSPTALAPTGQVSSTSNTGRYQYDALSYCWGDEEATKEMRFRNHESLYRNKKISKANVEYRSLLIKPNLDSALRQLRRDDKDVILWVDAVCINQNDMKEKTAQVRRMDEIYTQARNVCVWLGNGHDLPTVATFKFLEEILNPADMRRLMKGERIYEHLIAVIALMKNSWFSRRWIIQEICLAQYATVHWGSAVISWTDFVDAISKLMPEYDEIQNILISQSSMYPGYPRPNTGDDFRTWSVNTLATVNRNLFLKGNTRDNNLRLITLEVLVSRFVAFQASDSRDIIYAMISLAKDTWPARPRLSPYTPTPGEIGHMTDPRISPDYEKCLLDVYTDFTEYCVEKSGSLDIICRNWVPKPANLYRNFDNKGSSHLEDIRKLPSWIRSMREYTRGTPEERLRGRTNVESLVGNPDRHYQKNYNASSNLPSWFEFGRYPRKGVVQSSSAGNQSSDGSNLPAPLPGSPSEKHPSLVSDGTLSVRGLCFDVVQEISGAMPNGMIMDRTLAMGGWKLPPESNEEVPEKLWRTLVADRDHTGNLAPIWYNRACYELLSNYVEITGDLETERIIETLDPSSTIYKFADRVQAVTWSRNFFTTKRRFRRSGGVAVWSRAQGDNGE